MKNSIKIDPFGFREYDARWLYEKDINAEGIVELGKGLGTQIKSHTKKNNPRIVVGHDYRSYSEEIKSSLKKGLLSTGCNVEDIGLSLSPMVYFAQFNLETDAVALAIRFDSPIYTYSKILENAGIILKKEIDGKNAENLLPDEYKTLTLKQLNKKISDAIENEDYELAAKLRDEINQRK